MTSVKALMGFGFLALASSFSYAEDFPSAPPRLKDAEAQGLQRVNVEELKQYIPGTMVIRGVKGKHKKIFRPDGSVWRSGFMEKEQTGKWHFDEKSNAFCNAFQEKKGYSENCFAVFRAPDGSHFFSYEVDTGFYAHVWRPSAE